MHTQKLARTRVNTERCIAIPVRLKTKVRKITNDTLLTDYVRWFSAQNAQKRYPCKLNVDWILRDFGATDGARTDATFATDGARTDAIFVSHIIM